LGGGPKKQKKNKGTARATRERVKNALFGWRLGVGNRHLNVKRLLGVKLAPTRRKWKIGEMMADPARDIHTKEAEFRAWKIRGKGPGVKIGGGGKKNWEAVRPEGLSGKGKGDQKKLQPRL